MASWQFDLFFAPEAGPLPVASDDGYEIPALSKRQVARAESFLLKNFGQPVLVMEGFFIYGQEQGNRVDISLNEDGSAELRARIDARSDSESFVQSVCTLSSSLGCTLFSPEFACPIEPNFVALQSAQNRSRSCAFVRDPHDFLSNIKHDG